MDYTVSPVTRGAPTCAQYVGLALFLALACVGCEQTHTEPKLAQQPAVAMGSDAEAPTLADASADAEPSGSLPCAVESILRAKCQQCHGNPTAQTAPMSLTTLTELHAPAPIRSDTPARVYERMSARLHDGLRPMPPRDQPALAGEELAVLNAWAEAGAPGGNACPPMTQSAQSGPVQPDSKRESVDAGTPADAASPAVQPADAQAPDAQEAAAEPETETEPDPEPSECEYVEIRANADGAGAPFAVPADATDLYQCFVVDLAFKERTQALAFEHVLDNIAVVHHLTLSMVDPSEQTSGNFTCADMRPSARILETWGPGTEAWKLPKDVGLDLNSGVFLLEIHYNNIAKPATTDSSGIRICTTRTPQPIAASVSWLGSQFFTIPPRSSSHAIANRCTPSKQTEPIHMLRIWPHMHMRGVRASMQLDRAAGGSEVLLDKPYAFENQKAYETSAVLQPGDSLLSTCYYDNPSNFTVPFGQGTAEEMCHFIVIAYPADQLINDAWSLENGVCLGAP